MALEWYTENLQIDDRAIGRFWNEVYGSYRKTALGYKFIKFIVNERTTINKLLCTQGSLFKVCEHDEVFHRNQALHEFGIAPEDYPDD